MKSIFKKLKSFSQKIINILVGIINFIFYFLFITPLAIFIRPKEKNKSFSYWKNTKEVENIKDFLKSQ